jgi:hypothetical protein
LNTEGLHRQSSSKSTARRKLSFNKFKQQMKIKRKKRKDALPDNVERQIKLFYMREDISRPLPSKRYTTKHGAGYVLQQTLKAAFRMFKLEHPDIKVGYTKFTKLRPKNVRLISNKFLESCLCQYCNNVRLKLLALNRAVRLSGLDETMRINDERGLFNLLMCEKSGPFHDASCIKGQCSRCGDHAGKLRSHFHALLQINPSVTWTRWCTITTKNGSKKAPKVRCAEAATVVEELVKDVVKPTKTCSFLQHLFTADWQHKQYKTVKENLKGTCYWFLTSPKTKRASGKMRSSLHNLANSSSHCTQLMHFTRQENSL